MQKKAVIFARIEKNCQTIHLGGKTYGKSFRQRQKHYRRTR
jgi:hypothetical protein